MNPLKLIDGYKTYLIGAAAVVVGLYKYNEGEVGAEDLIWYGLGLVGIGHKLDKLKYL